MRKICLFLTLALFMVSSMATSAFAEKDLIDQIKDRGEIVIGNPGRPALRL